MSTNLPPGSPESPFGSQDSFEQLAKGHEYFDSNKARIEDLRATIADLETRRETILEADKQALEDRIEEARAKLTGLTSKVKN